MQSPEFIEKLHHRLVAHHPTICCNQPGAYRSLRGNVMLTLALSPSHHPKSSSAYPWPKVHAESHPHVFGPASAASSGRLSEPVRPGGLLLKTCQRPTCANGHSFSPCERSSLVADTGFNMEGIIRCRLQIDVNGVFPCAILRHSDSADQRLFMPVRSRRILG